MGAGTKEICDSFNKGGDSYDPTRYTDDETYFEYGCDGADGLFSDANYYHPDMLLAIPKRFNQGGKIPLSFAKKMVFPDPYACMIFQLERMEDLGSAHNFRVAMAKYKCSEEDARMRAKQEIFDRTVIFGLGTTGIFIGDLIRKKYPNAKIVFVARSGQNTPKVQYAIRKTNACYVQNLDNNLEKLGKAIERQMGGKATVFIGVSGTDFEYQLAFKYGLLGNNGIYNSFSLGPTLQVDSMPFGFHNHLIFSSINFRREHMEKAIQILTESNYDEIVELIDKDIFIKDPMDAYYSRIYSKAAPLKTAVVWNEKYINMEE